MHYNMFITAVCLSFLNCFVLFCFVFFLGGGSGWRVKANGGKVIYVLDGGEDTLGILFVKCVCDMFKIPLGAVHKEKGRL